MWRASVLLALLPVLGCEPPSAAGTSGATATTTGSAPATGSAATATATATGSAATATATATGSAATATGSAARATVEAQTYVPEVPIDFTPGKGSLTVAFDGSQRFSLWLRLLRFAREIERTTRTRPHFTFFVNACFYSTDPGKSDVGRARSRGEILVRRALTQMAINDGHEIGSHGALHVDGSQFTRDAWAEEFDRFDQLLAYQLFTPVRDAEGRPVFPRFAPLPAAAARGVGAACTTDDDCESGRCLTIDDDTRLCTQACNLKAKCPEATFCGAPMFQKDTDVCLPLPVFPVVLDGETLFDAKGAPNPKSKRLAPYRVRGFRAPYLGSNTALYDVLLDRGYTYDTSQATHIRAPYALRGTDRQRTLLEFPLMAHAASAAVPMDYNYQRLGISGERMRKDYETSIVHAFEHGRLPWNIGHHFATWEEGIYLDALLDTVRFAAAGCPEGARPWKDGATRRCEGLELLSFEELAARLRKK